MKVHWFLPLFMIQHHWATNISIVNDLMLEFCGRRKPRHSGINVTTTINDIFFINYQLQRIYLLISILSWWYWTLILRNPSNWTWNFIPSTMIIACTLHNIRCTLKIIKQRINKKQKNLVPLYFHLHFILSYDPENFHKTFPSDPLALNDFAK